MKAMIRVNSLTLGGAGNKTLHSMERHGKRQDRSSRMRHVRDVDPLVYGTLDLRRAYDQHMTGVRTNAGMKRPVMHAIIKFPADLPITAQTEEKMLGIAVAFINATHGGHAVFAGRLDRDEEGQHVVDVFYAPRYEKITKTRKGEETGTWWMSTTKHGKDLCRRHRAEIEARNDERKFTTGPRQVGIALQSALYAYLGSAGLDLIPRLPKNDPRPDRQEIEAFKATQDAKQAAARIREIAHEEGYAAGVAAAAEEMHTMMIEVQDLKDGVSAFIARLIPMLTQRQAGQIDHITAILIREIDATAERLDSMSDQTGSYSGAPGL